MTNLYILFIQLLSIVILSSSCSEEVVNSNDPADLNVIITVAENGSGQVIIEATAKNTVEFQLLIGDNDQIIETSNSGYFKYAFDQSGTFNIKVRAYGESGRFIQEIKSVTILLKEDDILLDEGYVTPLNYQGYTLVWHDEFNENAINTDDWTFEIGDGCPNICGWGNNEQQYYREENTRVENGTLIIEARNEIFGGKSYTSSRIKTQNKKTFKYGRIDIRALLPKGQGIWPALWMLGSDITSVSWPACGEIDIMELIGGEGKDNTVHGTLHYENNGNHIYQGGHKSLPNELFADQYHVFSIEWDQNAIKWLMDDEQFYSVDITPAYMSEFHQEFFFIMNIAVGGNWPGNPDATTIFPQQMKVDYIRVFQTNK